MSIDIAQHENERWKFACEQYAFACNALRMYPTMSERARLHYEKRKRQVRAQYPNQANVFDKMDEEYK